MGPGHNPSTRHLETRFEGGVEAYGWYGLRESVVVGPEDELIFELLSLAAEVMNYGII